MKEMNKEKKLDKRKQLGIGIGIGVLVLIAAGIVATIRFSQPGGTCSAEKTVDIAANLPMTGDLATYGDAIHDGAVMALEDLKESDPSGACLNFDWQDNGGNPQTAVAVFQKQYLQPPDIYTSGLKPQAMAIKDQVQAKGTPNFLWIFDVLINKNSRNNFRTLVSYKIEAPMYLKYVKERQPKRVAILYHDLPHGREEFQQLVIPQLKAMGIKAIYAEPYDINRKDYKDIAVKVRNFKPDLIILNGFQYTLVGLVRALRPLGLITDGNTIGTYDMIDAAAILGKDELEGIRVVTPLFEVSQNEKVTNWKQQFRTKYNRSPRYIDAFAYDMATIIHDDAKRLDLPANSEQWIAALRATKVECITGNPFCYFDKDGDLVTPVEIGVYRNGKLVPLSK